MRLYQAFALSANAYRAPRSDARLKEVIAKQVAKLELLLPQALEWKNAGFDLSESTDEKLVFRGSYQQQWSRGNHGGWSDHTVIAYASLSSGFKLRVTGSNRNDCKAEIKEMFENALNQVVET